MKGTREKVSFDIFGGGLVAHLWRRQFCAITTWCRVYRTTKLNDKSGEHNFNRVALRTVCIISLCRPVCMVVNDCFWVVWG
jgi:hypothetical protein